MIKVVQRILCVMLIAFIGCSIVACKSLAIWREERTKEASVVSEDEVNPSLRYQIFAPLDGNDNLLSYEVFSWRKHGTTGLSYITTKGYNIAFQTSGFYHWASFLELSTGSNLLVLTSTERYSSANHGYRCYLNVTSTGEELFVRSDNEFVHADSVPLNSSTELFVSVEQEGQNVTYEPWTPENESEYGALVASTITTSGRALLYLDSQGTYDFPSSDEVEEGVSLYVATFSSYNSASAEDQEEYGALQYANYTSYGYSLLVRDGGEYRTATPAEVEAGTGLYAISNIVAYALVGYTGIVGELVIPERYTDTATNRSYVVKRICAHPDYADYALAGNSVITKIIIPSTVTSIGDLALSNMQNLHEVEFLFNPNTITIGDYAFLGDLRLEKITCADAIILDKNGDAITPESAVFEDCPNSFIEGFIQ